MMIPFTKGHGTGNDFVLVFDPDCQFDLDEEVVALVCNRSFGIGADGLIRITKKDGVWFMDYRNADGTIAEICGNGTRVMAKYLVLNHLVDGPTFEIGTRAGLIPVISKHDGSFTVELGPVINLNEKVLVEVGDNQLQGNVLSAPNPHVVTIVSNLENLGNLLDSPKHLPTPILPQGANFEFVQIISASEVSMRVFERGVGETLSCGSGACAVAVFLQQSLNFDSPITINVPGGKLILEPIPENKVKLTGPAKLVAWGEIDIEALRNK